MNKDFQDLIKDICKKNNIKCHILSSNWVMVLEKGKIKRFIVGYKFDLNSHALGMVFDDKYATYELLKLNNISVCEYNLVYSINNTNDYAISHNGLDYVIDLFNKYNGDIVFKSNTGTCGSNVNRINSLDGLIKLYSNISSPNKSFSICPFYDIINEYRVIVLNNNIELIYMKENPIVYGDGKSTIKELLEAFNYEYFKNVYDECFDRVLAVDEEFIYSWKFNLSTGARANFDISSSDKIKLENLVCKMFENIDFGFCSIDIIKTVENEFLVLEINSGVMMKNLIKENNFGYNIARGIYEKAVLALFS